MKAALSLGANLGDRGEALTTALAAIRSEPRMTVVAVSSVYETHPVGGPDQPDYLNVVVVVASEAFGSPARFARALLSLAQAIETAQHRQRDVRWGPRTIDVDVLAVDDYVSADPVLTVPHPRLAERAFVLLPWAEVDPTFRVAGLGEVGQLAEALTDAERAGVRRR